MKTGVILLIFTFPVFMLGQQNDSLKMIRTIDSLIQLSRSLTDQRKPLEAFEKNERAKKMIEQYFGQNHRLFANHLFTQGRIYYSKQDYKNAVDYYTQSLDLRKKLNLKGTLDYARNLSNLGLTYHYMANYSTAEPILIEACTLIDQLTPSNAPKDLNCLKNLSLLYLAKGEFEKAESIMLDIIRYREANPNRVMNDYLGDLLNIGLLYRSTAQYAKAIRVSEKMLQTIQSSYNQLRGWLSPTLNNMGVTYRLMGMYKEAEECYFKSLQIREELYSKKSIEYASVLTNLGAFYLEIGGSNQAMNYLEESKAIQDNLDIPINGRITIYLPTLRNLALVKMEQGHYEEAINYGNLALNLQIQANRQDSIAIPSIYHYLGIIYARSGNYPKAIKTLEEYKAMVKAYSKNPEADPNYIDNLEHLGSLHLLSGNLSGADTLIHQAYQLHRKIFEPNNIKCGESSQALGLLHFYKQSYVQAVKYFIENQSVIKSKVIESLGFMSEDELSSFTAKYAESNDYFSSLCHNIKSVKYNALQFNNVLMYKGLLLDKSRYLLKEALSQENPNYQETYSNWLSYHNRLAKEYEKPFTERKNVDELKQKINEFEKQLTRSITDLQEIRKELSWKDIKKRLKPQEAVIEFFHFRYFNPKPTDSILYAALILSPQWDSPQWVYLFEEKQLNGLLSKHNNINGQYPQKLYAKELSDLVWEPLAKFLADTKVVYYAPSGLLHRISFPALATTGGKRLIDDLQLRCVTSSKVLLNAPTNNSPLSSALIYGGLNYDLSDTTEVSMSSSGIDNGLSEKRSWTPEQAQTRSRIWSKLPKSEEERERIARLLNTTHIQTSSLNGLEGTEETFKALGKEQSPDLLHMATHGYFFPNAKPDSLERLNYRSGGNYRFAENPLLRSGLILAGGNHAWTKGKALSGREDGILSAYEIAQMNLSKTKLVVLSACETGLGDIQGSEGVYGLQRAFKRAGVNYLIMTLWSIPDSEETVQFMETFYRNLIKKKMPVRDAFDRTQKEMKKKNPDPYYWAGFVLVE